MTAPTSIDQYDALDLAVAHISAEGEEPTGYIYFDDATSGHYISSTEDMIELGRMLHAGTRDAYSVWCSQTSATEVDIEAVVLSFPITEDTDLDALEAEAGSAGDEVTSMVLAHRRDEVESIVEQNAESAA